MGSTPITPISLNERIIMDDIVYVVRLEDRDYFRDWYKVDVLNFWREIKNIVKIGRAHV